ncbi:MAG TPA: prepilin-type N-terminal cleavage/methylation domain-containing protein [Nitrospiraceae bacterium]|nr:prepilin-type N-terminal cleavage/methylation domain-containing protein [Nitrospiraceae bacterium]
MTKLKHTNGFTLIEGMIAAAMIAVGLLALSGMQANSLGRNVDAKDLTTVTNLAADMVERIEFNRKRVAAYSGINSANVTTKPSTAELMARGDYEQWAALLTSSGLSGVTGTVAVTLQDANPATSPTSLGRRLVTVTVSWSAVAQGTGTRTRTVSLSTVVAPE